MQEITDNLCMMLIAMICYAGVLQKDSVRQVIFLLFGGVMLLQWMTGLVIEPKNYYVYYLIDCVALVFVMEIIAKIKPFTKACLWIQYLCGFGVALNIASAVLFCANIDHAITYSLIYVGIYIVTFLIMLNGSLNARTDDGVLSFSRGVSRIISACRLSNQASNSGA